MKKLVTKKETLKESIALMALMCALSAIMVAFVTYLPVSSIIFTFLIPLPSIIIGLYCKSKFYPIYFLSCLALSLIVGAGDIGYAISAILPSLIIAFVIGFLIRKEYSIYFTFTISSIVFMGLNMASLAILNYLFNIDFIEVMKNLLNINVSQNYSFLTLSFVYLYTLVQTLLTILISMDQIKFLVKDNKENKKHLIVEISTSLLLILITSIVFPYSYEFGYLLILISLVSGSFFLHFPAKTSLKSIIFVIFAILTWVLIVALLSTLGTKNVFILLVILPLLIDIFSSIYLCVITFRKQIKN